MPFLALHDAKRKQKMVKNLYLIAKGEFEISIKTLIDKKQEEGSGQYLNYLRPEQVKQASSPGPVKQQTQQTFNQKIVVMGQGNILAMEDIARISPHSYSAKCVSSQGVILALDVEKFHAHLKHIPDGFNLVTKINRSKWQSFFETLTKLQE